MCVAELRGLGGNRQVEGEDELERAGEAEAFHLRDHYLRYGGEPARLGARGDIYHVADLATVESSRTERLQVDAGSERMSRAGQHDHVDGLVGREPVES